jgi:putative ABC transport system permease protein
MLAESLVLATIGGALGVALGYLAIAPIKTLGTGSIPRVGDISLDGRVLALATLASIVTGVLFGLLPAWQASRTGVGAVLKDSGRSSTTSSGRWMRTSLLVVELALSIVLLTGAMLLIRSFAKMTDVDPGFKTDRVLAFQVALPQAAYPQPEQVHTFFDTFVSTR